MTPERRRAAAARRLGITLDEYQAHEDAGEAWCSGCKRWQPLNDFGPDRARRDGRNRSCRSAARKRWETRTGRPTAPSIHGADGRWEKAA